MPICAFARARPVFSSPTSGWARGTACFSVRCSVFFFFLFICFNDRGGGQGDIPIRHTATLRQRPVLASFRVRSCLMRNRDLLQSCPLTRSVVPDGGSGGRLKRRNTRYGVNLRSLRSCIHTCLQNRSRVPTMGSYGPGCGLGGGTELIS